MIKEQLLQLQLKFLLGYNMKTIIKRVVGINIWWVGLSVVVDCSRCSTEHIFNWCGDSSREFEFQL